MKKLLLLLSIIILQSPPVFALSEEQKKIIDSGIHYYNIEDDADNNFCGGGSGDFTGSNNAEIAFNYFVSKGLSNEQAAGIVGNAMAESGQSVDPTAVSPSGYRGIFQWDKNVRWPRLVDWAEERSLDELALETQLQFAWDEATDRGNIDGIKEYSDVEHTTWYWGRFYEVAIVGGSTSTTPLTNVQHLERRTEYARGALEAYGSAAGGGGSTGTSTSSCAGSLGDVECPANLEAHSTRAGYYRMPEAPNDEYHLYSNPGRRWGSQSLVCALYSVALAYNEAMAGSSKLRIGDLNATGHQTHNKGTAVDISGFGDIQAASHIRPWKGTYSKEATVTLGKLWVDTGILRNIWWCPPAGDTSIEEILTYAQETQGGIEGQMKCVDGHQDHFHVDIKAEYRLGEWEP